MYPTIVCRILAAPALQVSQLAVRLLRRCFWSAMTLMVIYVIIHITASIRIFHLSCSQTTLVTMLTLPCFRFCLGFYYVCVDFNPPVPPQAVHQGPLTAHPDDMIESTSPVQPNSTKPEVLPRTRRDSSRSARRVGRSSSSTRAAAAPAAATMSGFYFHQNSEP